jgi:uncharacterized protein (TIGR00255 family)
MTYSMTAFARQEINHAWGGLIWELRSVNHRYLDISLRLPEDLRRLEPAVRELLGRRLERGKVEASLRFIVSEDSSGAYDIDLQRVTRLLETSKSLVAEEVGLQPLRVIDILRWPGVIKPPELDMDNIADDAINLLNSAIDELSAMRQREGVNLDQLIRQRLDGVEKTVQSVQEIQPEVAQQYRQRLLQRMQEVKQELDPNRLEQEVVLFAQKSDVAEELERLLSHVTEVRAVLARKEAIGRRLDFLMQELFREANTLAAKAVNLRMTNAAVELKVFIEQMREQVQNIE